MSEVGVADAEALHKPHSGASDAVMSCSMTFEWGAAAFAGRRPTSAEKPTRQTAPDFGAPDMDDKRAVATDSACPPHA
jgi:hypothetical protein